MLGELEKEAKTQSITEIAVSLFLFFSGISWGGLKSCQKPGTAHRLSSKRGLFLECKEGREGGPLWVRESGENPFFIFVLLCFFSVLSCHSSGSPVADCCRVGKLKPWLSSQRTKKQAIFTTTPTPPLTLSQKLLWRLWRERGEDGDPLMIYMNTP